MEYWQTLVSAFAVGMAEEQLVKEGSQLSTYDAYFEKIQSRKKLPQSLQETLTTAFANIPVSSFPRVPGGKGDIASIVLAVPTSHVMK